MTQQLVTREGEAMARQQDWHREMHDAILHEAWSLSGPRRIVKVVPVNRPVAGALTEFVCLEKSLLGKAPPAIEIALELPPAFLGGGCRVFRFKRLPMTTEVEYELSAKYPNGLAFNSVMHDPAFAPGSPSIHQWRLLSAAPTSR